jgi:hypothetical protein
MSPFLVVSLMLSGLVGADEQEMKFNDCPAPVRKTLLAESKGVKIETVTKEDVEDETIYWADVAVSGKMYAIGVLEDGTLTEMNLAVDDDEIAFDRCPADVQSTFRREAFGVKIESVGKDIKYGVTIYEVVVEHGGKSFEIVVADDGTLVEKVLVIDDEEVELAACPAPVKAAFHEYAKGGTIHQITRSTGIAHPTFEAEIEFDRNVYLIEVSESGQLISKSLEADDKE